jgi:uncharacterized protein YgbK (DUF1537 family)
VGPGLLIVADDLTGALDSAAEAAGRGLRTVVVRGGAALTALDGSAADVVAVSTGSRDGSEAAAALAVAQVAAALPALDPRVVMKKVDSRLKGHVAVETAVLARALGAARVLAAPAIPDMGRVQRGGWLSGAGIDEPIAIARRFAGLDCVIPDAAGPDDFGAALLAAPDALPAGARGLAQALAARLWPDSRSAPPPAPQGPALVAIGSRDPITLAQAQGLRAALHPEWTEAPDGAVPDGADSGDAPLSVMQMTPGPGADPRAAGARFAAGIAARLRARTFGALIVTGGETADALLAALGCGTLTLRGALLPGIPVSDMAAPGLAPLRLITKSGGFGAPDALVRLATAIDFAAAGDNLALNAPADGRTPT